ncbi:MAG: hypothetical protein IJV75_00330 [Alphaproteobacteria bacterium]|nr:hypothetical protein [Alphaproteobacteria bacterium]
MKKGWVAMDKNGSWIWCSKKPTKSGCCWFCSPWGICLSHSFNIAPVEDWKKSLRKVE